MRLTAAVLLLGLLPVSVHAGDAVVRAARDENARRARLKDKSKVYTNLEGPAALSMLVSRPPAAEFVGPPWPPPESPPSASPARPPAAEVPAEPPHDESYWRERLALARQRIKELESDLEWTRGRYFVLQAGLDLANDAKREFDRKIEHDRLLAEQDRLERELAAARAEPDRIREEGRREGALPGWFR